MSAQTRRPGRPRKHEDNADRQRAYRARQRRRSTRYQPPAARPRAEAYSGPVYQGRVVIVDGVEMFIGSRVPDGEIPPRPALPKGWRLSPRAFGFADGVAVATPFADVAAELGANVASSQPFGTGVLLVHVDERGDYFAYGSLFTPDDTAAV